MRRQSCFSEGVLGVIGSVCLAVAPLASQTESVLSYLPDETLLEGWEALGDPQTAEGDDLFLLINGGAEIYNEFGFVRAVMHSYDKGEKSVNLEVYEMEDVASAYGAYSFKTSRDGESVDIGSEAKFEEYYLNFWKGNVVVTLVGFDTDTETRDAILALAKMVEAKITASGPRPNIVDVLPEFSSTGTPVHPTYVEGNLGLINRYRFGAGGAFGFSKAVVGEYDDYLLLAIPYDDTSVAAEHFAAASQEMNSSDLFTDVVVSDSDFAGVDRNGRFVTLRLVRDFIVAYVGKDIDHASKTLESLVERVVQYPRRQER